jgi:hypothetical protein
MILFTSLSFSFSETHPLSDDHNDVFVGAPE